MRGGTAESVLKSHASTQSPIKKKSLATNLPPASGRSPPVTRRLTKSVKDVELRELEAAVHAHQRRIVALNNQLKEEMQVSIVTLLLFIGVMGVFYSYSFCFSYIRVQPLG